MPDNVENMTLVGAGAYQGEGNSLANIITGSVADNWLASGDGNDTVSGGAGDDAIFGGPGDDWIRGGTGADYLVGNEGADKFVYYSVAEVGFAGDGTGDLIRDFASVFSGASERDRIDLHRIDANTATADDDAFHFIGGAFTGTAGELRDVLGIVLVVDPDPYVPEPPFESAVRMIEGDVDGDGAADFQLAVIQQSAIALSVSDFFL
jgi:serralysin